MGLYYDRAGCEITLERWAELAEGAEYGRVDLDCVGDITVSTIWLGIDYNFGYWRPPIIFETMIFGPRWNFERRHYATEEQAMRGHLDVVDRLRAGQPPFDHCDEDGDDE